MDGRTLAKAMLDTLLQRRRHERVPFACKVAVMLDTPEGLISRPGMLIDISEGGCAFSVRDKVPTNVVGRIELEVDGTRVELPVRVCWVHELPHVWKVGCRFDNLGAEPRALVRRLVQGSEAVS